MALEELTLEQQATNDLLAASDSVTLINNLIADTAYTAANASANVLNSIDGNYRHLDIVLARDYVIANNGGANLAVYSTAAASGKAYIVAAKAANNTAAADIDVPA